MYGIFFLLRYHTKTNLLISLFRKYTYHDKKAGKSSTGALRGVCYCCICQACDLL